MFTDEISSSRIIGSRYEHPLRRSVMAAQARPASQTDDREVVAGLVHGLSVLQAFQRKPRLTQSELSSLTGLTRATARRSLITLASLGYVDVEDNFYRLSPKVIELASGYFNSNEGWVAIAAPYLEVLRNKVEENVSAV